MLTCGSPQLIAAYRVLLRQSVPWHPPCALVRLILPVHVEHYFLRLLRVVFNKDCLLYCFFPVQFSRCVEVSLRFPFPLHPAASLPFLFGFDPSKRYRNHHFVCQTPLTCWPTLSTPCVVVASSVRGFAGFSGFLQLMLLSCRPRI